MFSKRISNLEYSKTSEIRNLAKQMQADGIPVVNLAAGELDIDTSEFIKQAAIRAIISGKNKYTETLGINSLKNHLVESLTSTTKVSWQLDEVGVTAGAKQALFNAAMVLFQTGDEVIVPTPCWATFPAQISLSGAKPIFLDTTRTNYGIEIDDLKNIITPVTKGIVINTPNNPSGVVYDFCTLEKLAHLVLEKNLWIVFDESYKELMFDSRPHVNIITTFPEIKSRAIIINSFSKTFALSGWRIGYFAAPISVVNAIKTIQSHSTSNPNIIAQYAALEALGERGKDFVHTILSWLTNNRHVALEILDTVGDVIFPIPQGGFFIYVNVGSKLRRNFTFNGIPINDINTLAKVLLEKAHVAVVPGSVFGDHNGLRISFSGKQKDLIKGMTSLAWFLNSLR